MSSKELGRSSSFLENKPLLLKPTVVSGILDNPVASYLF
jgi:hypothetical protein